MLSHLAVARMTLRLLEILWHNLDIINLNASRNDIEKAMQREQGLRKGDN